MRRGTVLLAAMILASFAARAQETLDGGVLIFHSPPEISYTDSPGDWCQHYLDGFAIDNAFDQVNRSDLHEDVWYVLAAWLGPRTFGGVEFGFADYQPWNYRFSDWGPCCPTGGCHETPTVGWPDPNTGVLITADSAPWCGNYVPVYYFLGYAYDAPVQMPLGIHPVSGFGGFISTDEPPLESDAECFGALGFQTYGIACFPRPNDAACCVGQACSITDSVTCAGLGGTWIRWITTCDPDPCVPDTFLVNPAGTGDYATIQEAIDASWDGDIIELDDGTFTGLRNRMLRRLDRDITIRSQSGNPAACIIDCEDSSTDGFQYYAPDGPVAALEGLTVTRAFRAVDCIDGASPEITNCVFFLCDTGIMCSGSGTHPVITGCTLSENTRQSYPSGMRCDNGASVTLTDCTFIGNAAGGLELYHASVGILHGCIFVSNLGSWGGGLRVSNAISITLTDCTFYENHAEQNGAAMYVNGTPAMLSRCTLADNILDHPTTGGIYVQAGSAILENCILAFNEGIPIICNSGTATLTCCDVYGNVGGDWVGCIEAQAGTNGNIAEDPLFCGTFFGDDDLTLLDESPCAAENNPGCGQIGAWPIGCNIVYVEPDGSGEYDTIQEAVDAAGEGGIVILGDGIFQGEGNRAINFRGRAIILRTQTRGRQGAIIDCQGVHGGFIFSTGEGPRSIIDGVTVINGNAEYGGAVFCSSGTSPTLVNCTFESNVAVQGGGGIACWGDAAPTIENCHFEGNSAPDGAGLFCRGTAAPELTNCAFVANRASSAGGGAYCGDSSQPLFTFCTFEADSADENGGALNSRANSAPTLRNCTLVKNSAPGGGGIRALGDLPVLENVIIAFGTQGTAVGGGGVVTLSCCDLYGNAGGDWVGAIAAQNGINGNFSLGPEFCDFAGGDYHLWNYSPCNQVGCGLIGAWPIGCEDPQVVVETLESMEIPAAVFLASALPNPFRGTTQISCAVPQATRLHLAIYDVTGRMVRTLLDRRVTPGEQTLVWDGRDDRKETVAAGIYYLRLETPAGKKTRSVVVLR
ncbi:MAG: right-handed parallel beta-helix repeat-containing protein [Candidatus Eisenbacteria sp.]|nr:right-handed parallel beta-helix repeat-containing protein [Candidatus Eisenbacteria bacterium]